jgi:hypothetical protein
LDIAFNLIFGGLESENSDGFRKVVKENRCLFYIVEELVNNYSSKRRIIEEMYEFVNLVNFIDRFDLSIEIFKIY